MDGTVKQADKTLKAAADQILKRDKLNLQALVLLNYGLTTQIFHHY